MVVAGLRVRFTGRGRVEEGTEGQTTTAHLKDDLIHRHTDTHTVSFTERLLRLRPEV